MGRPRKARAALPGPRATTCVLYARVSSKEQRDGYSLDAQLGILRRHAEGKGFTVVAEFVVDESAKSPGRSAFSKMCDVIRRREAATIIVDKTDRFYRNFRDPNTISDLMDSHGLEVHFVSEGLVLHKQSRSHEKLQHDLFVVIAKNYIDRLKEEVDKGMGEKARQGGWNTKAPLGYLNERVNGRAVIVPDPERAFPVVRLFETYSRGDHSISDLSGLAREVGLLTKAGKPVGKSQIYAMLRNPAYAGFVTWKGETFAGTHVALVPLRLFERVQAVMDGRGATQPARTPRDFPFKGLVRCADCGCTISPYVAKGTYTYYACTGAKGCRRSGVREEELTDQFAAVLEAISISPNLARYLKAVLIEENRLRGKDDAERRAELNRQRVKSSADLERFYLDRVGGQISQETYESLRSKGEAELSKVAGLLDAMDRAGAAHMADNTRFLDLLSNCHIRFKKVPNQQKRMILNATLANCTLKDGKLGVSFKPWFEKLIETKQAALSLECEEDRKQLWWA